MITAEQLDFRKGKLGASDAAAALGISPWKTRKALYHEILGHITPEPLGEIGELGNRMEPVIMEAFERKTGKKADAFTETLIHPKYEWLICHLDGMSGLNTIMEIKCVGPRMIYDWGEDGDPKGVPIYVATQVTAQAIIADVEDVDVVALLGGNDLRVYPLKITKEAKSHVLGGLVSFWEKHIVPEIPPQVTDKDLDLLKTLYKRISNDKILHVESAATAASFHDYRQLKQEIKAMKVRADRYRAVIQESMGENTVMMRSGDPEFTWNWTKDGERIHWEMVARAIDYKFSKLIDQWEPGLFLKEAIEANTEIIKGDRVFLDKSKDYK